MRKRTILLGPLLFSCLLLFATTNTSSGLPEEWFEEGPRDSASPKQVKPGDSRVSFEYHLGPGEDGERKARSNIFIRVETNKTTCYKNELVTATYTLYTRLIDSSKILHQPDLTGFTFFTLEDNREMAGRDVTIGNKVYRARTLKKVLLIPSSIGRQQLGNMATQSKIQFIAQKRQADLESSLAGLMNELEKEEKAPRVELSLLLKSEPAFINVLPLPPTSSQAETDLPVGSLSLRDTLMKKGEGSTTVYQLRVAITGTAYLPLVDTPSFQVPSGLSLISMDMNEEMDPAMSYLNSSKVFIFTFEAEKDGTYTIPAATVPFFDPETRQYRNLQTKAWTFPAVRNRRNGETLSNDEGKNEKSNLGPFRTITIWVVSLAGVLSLIFLLYFLRKNRKTALRKETPVTVPTPEKSGVELLSKAYRLNAAGERRLSIEELNRTLIQFIAGKYNIPPSAMNRNSIGQLLEPTGLSSVHIQHVQQIMSDYEMLLFGGVATSELLEVHLARAEELIRQVNQATAEPGLAKK